MKCVEDQIKDNIGFSQGMSDLGWMGREEVQRESGGWRKAWEEASVAEEWNRKKKKKKLSGRGAGGRNDVIEWEVMRQEGVGERLAG